MKIRVSLTVEIDPDKWSKNNGTERSEIREDVQSYVLNQIQCAASIEEADGTADLSK